VDEPDVDVVGFQPLQGGVEVGEHRPPGGVQAADAVAPRHPRLGAHDELRPRDDRPEEHAEQLLRGPVAVGGRGVDQGAAGVHELLELVGGLVLVGVSAPGQGPQTESGHAQPAPADETLLHGRNLAAPGVRPRAAPRSA
jgi:hypothetical protein